VGILVLYLEQRRGEPLYASCAVGRIGFNVGFAGILLGQASVRLSDSLSAKQFRLPGDSENQLPATLPATIRKKKLPGVTAEAPAGGRQRDFELFFEPRASQLPAAPKEKL
jgi:hypothetical protein